jgi:hypothetical protein
VDEDDRDWAELLAASLLEELAYDSRINAERHMLALQELTYGVQEIIQTDGVNYRLLNRFFDQMAREMRIDVSVIKEAAMNAWGDDPDDLSDLPLFKPVVKHTGGTRGN